MPSYIPKLVENKGTNLLSEGVEGFLEKGKPPFIPKLICRTASTADFVPAPEPAPVPTPKSSPISNAESNSAPVMASVPPPRMASVSPRPATMEQSAGNVNQVTYAVLALLLGGLGVHKFYAGKIGLGIVYLLFSWTFIPGLVGVIEGILAFTKRPDANGNISV